MVLSAFSRLVGRVASGVLVACFTGAASMVMAWAESDVAREFEVSWDLCGAATRAVEGEAGIPGHLLKAISIAESGRRDDLNKMNIAWPWTVTSGSREWYADTRQQAIDVVEDLLEQGIQNIDVGCMQINLYYHGDAFPSLDVAFDPMTNVRYAATYLEKLRQTAPDWVVAAGNYHSTTPRFHKRYRKRLVEIWDRERRISKRSGSSESPESIETMPVYSSFPSLYTQEPRPSSQQPRPAIRTTANGLPAIDYNRTQKLNDAFKNRHKRQAAERAEATENESVSTLSPGSLGQNYALQARMNRIRKAVSEQQQLEDALRAEAKNQAPEKAANPDLWRKMYNKALSGNSSTGTSLYGNL